MATHIVFFTLNLLPLVHVQSMGTTTKNENVSSPSKKFISFSLSLLCVGIACLHEKRGSGRPLNTWIRQKIKTKRADLHFKNTMIVLTKFGYLSCSSWCLDESCGHHYMICLHLWVPSTTPTMYYFHSPLNCQSCPSHDLNAWVGWDKLICTGLPCIGCNVNLQFFGSFVFFRM